MVKMSAFRLVLFAGLVSVMFGVSAEPEAANYEISIELTGVGNPTPEALASGVKYAAQNIISERDAVESFVRTYGQMMQEILVAVNELEAVDMANAATAAIDLNLFFQLVYGNCMQVMVNASQDKALVFAIIQECLGYEIFSDIGPRMAVKMQELIAQINGVAMPETNQEIVAFFYDAIKNAITVAVHDVVLAIVLERYPQHADLCEQYFGTDLVIEAEPVDSEVQ